MGTIDLPGNFSYIIPGKLAGCAQPGGWSDMRSDLAGLARMGIGAIVSLTEDPLDLATLRDVGLRGLHLPVPDFTAPTLSQIREYVAFVDDCFEDGLAVVTHCAAGIGRTGTMLACYLVHAGMTATQAIQTVRRERPGSIETAQQEQCVAHYYRNHKGRTKPRR